MPSFDTSLPARLANAGIPAQLAADINAAILAAMPNQASIAITGGTISGVTVNNSPIGNTTPSTVRASNLGITSTDSSGTPGNVTNNSGRGKAAFATGTNTVTVTNSLVAATSTVLCVLEQTDATLTDILNVVPGTGSFVVTGNANATGTPKFSFVVLV